MLRILKDSLGLSIAGGLKKYSNYYENHHSLLDSNRVNCRVTGWTIPRETYQYSAFCYCNDAFALPAHSRSLTIFESKKFASRQEAEAALDIDIIHASKIFKDTEFFRERYYPDHDAVGEMLCCRNGVWREGKDDTLYICTGCNLRYSEFPDSKICKNCGELLT